MKKQMIYALIAASIAAPLYGYNYTFVNRTAKKLGVSMVLKGVFEQPEAVGFMAPHGEMNDAGQPIYIISKNFGGLKAGLCAEAVQIGDVATGAIMTAPIFELSDLQYNEIISIVQNPKALKNYMEKNRVMPAFSAFGFCFNRTFDVIEFFDGSFGLLTRASQPKPI